MMTRLVLRDAMADRTLSQKKGFRSGRHTDQGVPAQGFRIANVRESEDVYRVMRRRPTCVRADGALGVALSNSSIVRERSKRIKTGQGFLEASHFRRQATKREGPECPIPS